MTWLPTSLGMLAVSQLLFTGLYYLIYQRRRRMAVVVVLFCLALSAYILSRLPFVSAPVLAFVFSTLATLVPALLWLLARLLFEDKTRVHPAVWLMMALYVGLRAVGMLFYDGGGISMDGFFLAFFYFPQLIMLMFVLHVIYMAFGGLAGDLVEPRRRLRVPFSIGMGTVVAAILGSGFLGLGGAVMDSLTFAATFVLMLFINLATAGIQQRGSVVAHGSAGRMPANGGGAEACSQDRREIGRITRAMEQERLYTTTGLTIGQLADHLGMQEYRLRRIINQTLHYRNFNQYLNSYRIAEAARRLRDPAEARLSIYNIALDVGYASLSSFNKAFKETFGMTPSAYRSADKVAPLQSRMDLSGESESTQS